MGVKWSILANIWLELDENMGNLANSPSFGKSRDYPDTGTLPSGPIPNPEKVVGTGRYQPLLICVDTVLLCPRIKLGLPIFHIFAKLGLAWPKMNFEIRPLLANFASWQKYQISF